MPQLRGNEPILGLNSLFNIFTLNICTYMLGMELEYFNQFKVDEIVITTRINRNHDHIS
jgi:hypothetical protein